MAAPWTGDEVRALRAGRGGAVAYGDLRQSSRTGELVFSPNQILSYVSRYVTLLPGDVIFTGTPGQTQAVHGAT